MFGRVKWEEDKQRIYIPAVALETRGKGRAGREERQKVGGKGVERSGMGVTWRRKKSIKKLQ